MPLEIGAFYWLTTYKSRTIEGFTTDHINGDKLDNQRSNLRYLSNVDNIRRRGPEKTSTTGYKGVYLYKNKNAKKGSVVYMAGIRVDKKLIHLGYYRDIKMAVEAYNAASLKYHKDFSYQNKI